MSANYFELFGLAQSFAIDRARLDNAYRALQNRLHPDRFANASEAECVRSTQASSHINAAYAALCDPLSRARHLLELAGANVATDTAAAIPSAFLMEQMQWREAMEEAHRGSDGAALRCLSRRLQQETSVCEMEFTRLLEHVRDLDGAANCLRKLAFYASLRRDLKGMIEALEDTRAF